ncbi:MAG: hypothetical protein Q4E53_10380 [Eubacteriales bacterium]|nr:hypothetical protein [Eubacteriales bacterium]
MKKNIIIMITLIVSVMALSVALIFYISGRKKEPTITEEKTVASTEKVMESTTENVEEDKEKRRKEDELLSRYTFLHLERIYQLPEDDREFRLSFIEYIQPYNIKADRIRVLTLKQDDGLDDGKAYNYLQCDDENATPIEVVFDKKSGRYSFQIFEKYIENVTDYDGIVSSKSEAEYLSTEEDRGDESPEAVILPKVHITDLDGELSTATDISQVEKKLEQFLAENNEKRRNLYVISVGQTGEGFEAKLAFEKPRFDGKSILMEKKKGQTEYSFSLVY